MTKYHSSIMEGQFDSEVTDDFYEHYGFRYSGRDDSYEAASKKQEYYNTMVDVLKGIFNSARQYDADVSPSFHPLQEGIDNISSVMASLSGSISRKSPHHGLWRIPAEELAASLAANDDALLEAVRNRFAMLDENGNLVYDWDEIERVLQKDADDISAMEYMILAGLFADMGEEDLTRFVQILAEPSTGFLRNQDFPTGERIPTWIFDNKKALTLKIALAATFAKENRSYSKDSLMRMSLLAALPTLGLDSGPGSRGLGLAGDIGAAYPPMTIIIDPVTGEYVIDYQTVGRSPNDLRDRNSFPADVQLKLIPTKDALTGTSDLLDRLVKELQEYLSWGYDDTVSVILEIVGFVPIADDLASLVVGAVSGSIGGSAPLEGEYEAQQFDIRFKNGVEEAKNAGNIYSRFDFEIVIGQTTGASAGIQLFVYPGDSTDIILDRLNGTIDDNSNFGLGYPVTASSIINNPEAANALIDHLIANGKSDYVFRGIGA